MGNNKYQVILPKQDKYGNYEVNIDEVILNNKKSFKNKEDYELNSVTYSVLKSIPSVTILSLTKNENNKTVDVKFKVNDPDNAITKLNAVVIDGNEKIIDSKDVQNLSEITLSYDSLDNVRYVVQFIADYDLGTEDEIYQEKVIGEKDFYLESSIVIVNDKLSTKYPSKGQEIYLYLDIKIPKGFKPSSYPVGITDLITGITINGINYSAQRTKTENDYTKYTVNFIAPNESGVLDLEINRVTFFDGSSYWITPYNSKLEVLKDKPQVENFKIVEENYEKGNVTFKFNINDDNGGFDGGVINLNEQSKEITKGENTVKFDNILTDEIFNLEILGNYDLDSNALDSENNYHQNSKLFSVPYGLFKENYFNTLELNNISVISKNNNVYFEKQEDIKINFEVANLDNINNFDISKIIVMDKEYSVTKNNDNTYSVIVDGFNKAGVKHFNIDEVILNNGKKVTLENPPKISLEVLKDALTINNFNFTATSSEVEVSMKLKDLDNSLVDNQIFIKVYDEDNNLLVSENYQNNFKFSRSNNLLRYYVKVYASYDRDNNTLSEGENSVTDALILNETISFVQNYLEIRDITNVLLYKNINGNASLMDTVNKDDIEKNFQDYFVKISMSNRADFYSNVIRVEEENNHLFLVLDYEYSVIDENGKTQNLRIDFGEIKDGNINNEIRPLTFEELIDAIKTNPDGKFILETDYDASDYITNSNTLIDVDFKGELDGNGHVIKNLYKPIFNNINGGTVKNLNLQNIYLSSNNANGALAIKTNNAIISDILIDNYNKTNSEATTGALIGNATNKTSIENCKVTKLICCW